MQCRITLTIAMAAIISSISIAALSQTLPSSSGAGMAPDEWLLVKEGPARWYKIKPSPTTVALKRRSPTEAEQSVIARVSALVATKPAKAFALMDGDSIVHLEYKAPADDNSVFFSFSMGKTVTSMAVGQAICAGKLKIDTKASDLIPELQNKALGKATVRDLLRMSSGAAEPASDSTIWTPEQVKEWHAGRLSLLDLIVSDRVAKAARGLFSDYEPGEYFAYKSTDPFTLAIMVSRATGMPFSHWLQDKVFNPMGSAQPGLYVQDPKQNGLADSGVRIRMEDWMRFALWVQRSSKEQGCFGDYVRAAMKTQIENRGTPVTRKQGKLFAGYGYQMWTENLLAPNTVWALGHGGQRISWSEKSNRMIIVFSNVENWMEEVYQIARDWDRAQP